MSNSPRRKAIKRRRHLQKWVAVTTSDGNGEVTLTYRRKRFGEVIPEWMPIVLADGTVIQ
jgi:hypothetical protein